MGPVREQRGAEARFPPSQPLRAPASDPRLPLLDELTSGARVPRAADRDRRLDPRPLLRRRRSSPDPARRFSSDPCGFQRAPAPPARPPAQRPGLPERELAGGVRRGARAVGRGDEELSPPHPPDLEPHRDLLHDRFVLSRPPEAAELSGGPDPQVALLLLLHEWTARGGGLGPARHDLPGVALSS